MDNNNVVVVLAPCNPCKQGLLRELKDLCKDVSEQEEGIAALEAEGRALMADLESCITA